MIENSTYNQEIGLQWLRQAEAEHASVASFARHTLQLMFIGAPSDILEASQEASIDEIKHAKMCYGVANTFMDKHVSPGVLDVKNSLGALDLKDMIQSIIREGCIEETLAAIEAHYRHHLAQDNAITDVIKEIAEDETRHAKLAWDTIGWIAKKFPDYNDLIKMIFNEQLDNQQQILSKLTSSSSVVCPDYGKEEYFHKFGILVPGDQEKVRSFGIKHMIKPTYEAGSDRFSSIFDNIMDLDVSII